MTNLRPMLYMALLVLGFLIWTQWQEDYNRPEASPVSETSPESSLPVPDTPVSVDIPNTEQADLPAAISSAIDQDTPTVAEAAPLSRRISVLTDTLAVEIDLVGATVVSANLPGFPIDQANPDIPVVMMADTGDNYLVAQSGLISSNSTAPNHTSAYDSDVDEYVMASGAEELYVPLTWQSEDGLEVTKTFIFHRGRFDIEVRHDLTNRSGGTWTGNRYDQLQRTQPDDSGTRSFTNPGRYSYVGGAVYSPEDKFEKVKFEDIAEGTLKQSNAGGWLAMVQHYFFTAWIPPKDEINAYSSQAVGGDRGTRYLLRAVSQPVNIETGQQHSFTSTFYVGPKLQDQLDTVADGLSLTVDYGIFTIFSKPLFWLLSNIHNFVANWGWSIILLTLLIKLAFFKLSEAQYKSMAKMRKLQPRIEALKERYGDDRQAMSQAMMGIYKKEKVNPLGGCLPILVQIPIFIALYWVLLESVELRQAPFIGWITNLSARDPYFILPVLNGVFMILTQRMTPSPGMDPMQRKIMSALPLVFSVMFAFFPAGLVLYWATNAGLSLLQQWYITRKIIAEG